MEESSSCPICLESLFGDGGGDGSNAAETLATGATVPCGHLCHVKCWDEWMAASMTNHRQQSTKCPMCNSATTSLVRLFLTVPTARNQRNDDDDDDSEESGMESDDDDHDDGELGETSPTIAATTTSRLNPNPRPRSVNTPTILDLLSDDDDDNDHDGPVIVTIDDDPVVIDVTATERLRSPNVTLASHQNTKKNKSHAATATHTNSSSKNNKMSLSLQKYRRKVRTLRQQKKTLQSQSHKNLEQYRKTLETLATTQQAYDDLTTQFAALEKTEHDTQLRYNQIMLQQVQMQRRNEAAQEQLQQQAALLQTKQAEMQRMQEQHAKQFKEYRNKNPQQLREVQTILQERPLLLEQVRTLQQQLAHHQQQRSSSSSSRSSDSVPTTTHRQRQELLRTIRQGIDDSATVPPPLPSKKRRQVAVESMEQMSDVAPWDWTHRAGPTLFRSAQSKTLTNVPNAPTKARISKSNHQSLTNRCQESDNDDERLRDLQTRNQLPLKRSSHLQEPRRVHSTKQNNEMDDDDDDDENRVPQRRHSNHPPPSSSSSSRPYDPSTKTMRGTNDPKRLHQIIMMHPPSFPSVATTTTQVPVVKKRQTTISFATKRA
jgi:Zinc finger, C3HC4 type (RING finger)